MEPLVSVEFRKLRRPYFPGDIVEFEYQVDAVEPQEMLAIEASILWYTEGKGDGDFGVHFFERRVPADAEFGDLRPLHCAAAKLPNSPLSYDGAIVKVCWCVRVRVFLRKGKEAMLEKPLQLGQVAAGRVKRAEGQNGESGAASEKAGADKAESEGVG